VDDLPIDQFGLAFDFVEVFYRGACFGIHGGLLSPLDYIIIAFSRPLIIQPRMKAT
jgi:hypothetical protein